MDTEERKRAAERLRTAFRLFDDGVALKRAQLHRRHPTWTRERIDQEIRRWLQERPGAEHGDITGGRLRPLPEEP